MSRRGKLTREDRAKREARNARRGRDSKARADARAPSEPRTGRIDFKRPSPSARAQREEERMIGALLGGLMPGRRRVSKGGGIGR